MNTENTSNDEFGLKPSSCARLPGDVTVQWHDWRSPGMRLEYSGRAEALIACGAATAEMLIMNKPNYRGPRRKRRDADGERFEITRYFRSTDEYGEPCAPYHWYRLRRVKANVDGLPGSAEAILAMKRYRRWEQAQHQIREREAQERQQEAMQVAPRSTRPQLRLVVDNRPEKVMKGESLPAA